MSSYYVRSKKNKRVWDISQVIGQDNRGEYVFYMDFDW